MVKIESGKYKCGLAASSALNFAYAELTALRARVEDVEGMAKVISSLDPVKNTETGEVCSWDDLTDRYRELYRKDATALLRWLKEGKSDG
jgi:hypothetical protein